ncbi:MAG: hydroxyphenylacetyl-CoA thioesterase PaaI [Deferrisomatales bacterium]
MSSEKRREQERAGALETRTEEAVCKAIREASRNEPYARKMGIRCLEVAPGCCRVEMTVGEDMTNLFGMAHGGAVFSLLDEAFQVACNSHGVSAFALNLSVTYVSASYPGERLQAEAREVALTRRTATYDIRVTRDNGELVAQAQALAYRKGGLPPFLE